MAIQINQVEITQTKLDEMCNKAHVVPVPDYEKFFTNIHGELYVLTLSSCSPITPILEKLTPYKVDKKTNIATYRIMNYKEEIEDITNLQLCARTYFGYFPQKYLYCNDNYFIGNSSVKYLIDDIIRYTDDFITIYGIQFKRIYYNGEKPLKYFISETGIVYDDVKKRIVQHTFQHNMYHRTQLRITKNQIRRFGTHRLVYNTWQNKKPWIPDEIQINHKDGKKYHNILSNLEEVTQIQNIRHSKLTGLRDMPYSEGFIITLCELISSNKYDLKEIQKILKIPKEKYNAIKVLVTSIIRGKTWTDISKKYDFTAYRNNKYNRRNYERANKVLEEYIASGYNLRATHKKFPDMSYSGVCNICRGHAYPELIEKYNIDISKVRRNAMTKAKFREAAEMLKSGKTVEEVANIFGVDVSIMKSLKQTRKIK